MASFQEIRRRTMEEVARKNKISPERLAELRDERDNDYGIEPANTTRSVNTERGAPLMAKPSPDSFFPGMKFTSGEEGEQSDVRVFTSEDQRTQITQRGMDIRRLSAYIPPAEPMIATPVLPGAATKHLIPQFTPDMTPAEEIEAMRAVTTAQAAASMANQSQAIEAATSEAGKQIAAYKQAHPDYDFAAGTPQVPTPELYEQGGLSEELFGLGQEEMLHKLQAEHDDSGPAVGAVEPKD